MTTLKARLAAWPLAGRLGAAAVAGAAGALAHAPFDIAPAVFAPLLAGFVLLRMARNAGDAALMGAALGWGYFALSMTWITEPFQVDAAVTGWMAPFALVLLALLLGSFWAAALAFARWTGGAPWVLALAWSGAEMARAYLFTGFPWANLPQALVGSWGGQALAWLGPHGLMLAMAALVALALSVRAARWPVRAVCAGLVVLMCLPLPDRTVPTTPHTIRLVQPNARQDQKWDSDWIQFFVERQLAYTGAGAVPDLVIWPETALPYLAEDAQGVFDRVAQAARGAPVVLGIQRREGTSYFNGLVVLDATGDVAQTYDKHHLVPFGEYMPARWLFRLIEVGGLAARTEGGYAAGPGPRLLDLGPLGAALPLICYEAVFAHNATGTAARPAFLMQLTNDAWFGARSGPQQHLAQARMRAIEQGLPMVRAANTGISALIDPYGRVVAALALNTGGYLDVRLPAPRAPTVYGRTGDLPWAIVLLAGLGLALLRRGARRRAGGIDGIPPDA